MKAYLHALKSVKVPRSQLQFSDEERDLPVNEHDELLLHLLQNTATLLKKLFVGKVQNLLQRVTFRRILQFL